MSFRGLALVALASCATPRVAVLGPHHDWTYWATWDVDEDHRIVGPHRVETDEGIVARTILGQVIHDAQRCGSGWVFQYDGGVAWAPTFTADVEVLVEGLVYGRTYPVGDDLGVVDSTGRAWAGPCDGPLRPLAVAPGEPVVAFGGDEERWLARVGPGWVLESTDRGETWARSDGDVPVRRPGRARFRARPRPEQYAAVDESVSELVRISPIARRQVFASSNRVGAEVALRRAGALRSWHRVSEQGLEPLTEKVEECADGRVWSYQGVGIGLVMLQARQSYLMDCGTHVRFARAARKPMAGPWQITPGPCGGPEPEGRPAALCLEHVATEEQAEVPLPESVEQFLRLAGPDVALVRSGSTIGVWRLAEPGSAINDVVELPDESQARRVGTMTQVLSDGTVVVPPRSGRPAVVAMPPDYDPVEVELPDGASRLGVLPTSRTLVAVGNTAAELWHRSVDGRRWRSLDSGAQGDPSRLVTFAQDVASPDHGLLMCDGWACDAGALSVEAYDGRPPRWVESTEAGARPGRDAIELTCREDEDRADPPLPPEPTLSVELSDGTERLRWTGVDEAGPYAVETGEVPIEDIGYEEVDDTRYVRLCEPIELTRGWALVECVGTREGSRYVDRDSDIAPRDHYLFTPGATSGEPLPLPGSTLEQVVQHGDRLGMVFARRDREGRIALVVDLDDAPSVSEPAAGRDRGRSDIAIVDRLDLPGWETVYRFRRHDPEFGLVAIMLGAPEGVAWFRGYRLDEARSSMALPAPPEALPVCEDPAQGPLTPVRVRYVREANEARSYAQFAWVEGYGTGAACVRAGDGLEAVEGRLVGAVEDWGAVTCR